VSATLKARLAAGEIVLGSFANLGSPLAVEAMCLGGLDWVLVDLEHGGGSESDLIGQLHAAAATGAHALVRVEGAERARAGRALDSGAEGVMFPRIDSVEQASAAIALLRYPPEGERGVATYNRAAGFGMRPGAIDEARDRIVGVVQIESPEAVEASDEIAALDGVDVLFIGPGDLSHAMGIRGRLDEPAFRAAVERVIAAAEAAGRAAGILVPGPEQVAAAVRDGFRFIGVGSDSAALARAGATIAAARPVATGAGGPA
jgi:2-keto-3-deoxy-L-rhamnonate aldolase RhmA